MFDTSEYYEGTYPSPYEEDEREYEDEEWEDNYEEFKIREMEEK